MVGRLALVVAFVATFGIFAERVSGPGLHDPPPGGDERDYEALAFNLWKGRGFGYYWNDPEWRAPYLADPSTAGAVPEGESGYNPTAYRPPAFPFLWAITYATVGRDFGAIRFVNAALMAAATTCAAAIAMTMGGLAAALVTAIVLVLIPDLSLFAHERLTEALATFLVSLLAWLWTSASTREPSVGRALASGAVLGLLILARSIFVIWLPIALLMPSKRPSPGGTRRSVAAAYCLAACLLVAGPWWIRNIAVTGAFMPMGTQGSINLPAGFSQRALDNEGRWRSNSGDGAQEIEASGVNPFSIDYEVRLGQHRAGLARAWMRDHPGDVVRLMGLHVWQELRTRRGHTDWTWLLPPFLLALVYFRRHPASVPAATIFGATIVSIALTWGVTGRFLIPVQPLAVAVASAMGVSLAAQVIRTIGRRST